MIEVELARVGFAGRRFSEMQGLRRVVDGLSLLWLWMLMRTGWAETAPAGFLGASLIWIGSTMWGVGVVAGYYRERFGPVALDGEPRDDAPIVRAHAVYRLLLLSAALWLGGWFGFVLPMLTLHAARVTWRDWPHRAHWLLLVIVGTAFSLAMLAISHRDELLEWQWRFIWTAAPSLVVVGLLDHRALVESMRGRTNA